jgi:factor associated with neutral sphingomyelinase activation
MNVGLEIVSYSEKDGGKHKKKSMFLVFRTTEERDIIYGMLLKLVDLKECATAEKDVEYYTNKWAIGEMSNFDYLMILNSYAQRSFSDLT